MEEGIRNLTIIAKKNGTRDTNHLGPIFHTLAKELKVPEEEWRDLEEDLTKAFKDPCVEQQIRAIVDYLQSLLNTHRGHTVLEIDPGSQNGGGPTELLYNIVRVILQSVVYIYYLSLASFTRIFPRTAKALNNNREQLEESREQIRNGLDGLLTELVSTPKKLHAVGTDFAKSFGISSVFAEGLLYFCYAIALEYGMGIPVLSYGAAPLSKIIQKASTPLMVFKMFYVYVGAAFIPIVYVLSKSNKCVNRMKTEVAPRLYENASIVEKKLDTTITGVWDKIGSLIELIIAPNEEQRTILEKNNPLGFQLPSIANSELPAERSRPSRAARGMSKVRSSRSKSRTRTRGGARTHRKKKGKSRKSRKSRKGRK